MSGERATAHSTSSCTTRSQAATATVPRLALVLSLPQAAAGHGFITNPQPARHGLMTDPQAAWHGFITNPQAAGHGTHD